MKLTKTQLKQIIIEELNEVAPLGTPWSVKMASQGLGQPRWRRPPPEMEEDETDPISAFQELFDKWQPRSEEGQQYKDDLGGVLSLTTIQNENNKITT